MMGKTMDGILFKQWQMVLPLHGERGGVRASVNNLTLEVICNAHSTQNS
jgi:hypothetical protein